MATPYAIRVHGAFAYRMESGATDLGPHAGFSLGGMLERQYLALRGGGELGVALDGSYTRFATAVTGSAMIEPGQEMTYAAERTLSQTGFALLQTVAWKVRRMRPFAAIGGGVTIGYFSSPELALRPGSASSTQPMGRASAGVDIGLSPTAALTFRASYTHTFSRPTFTTDDGASHSLFGSLLDVGAGMMVRF